MCDKTGIVMSQLNHEVHNHGNYLGDNYFAKFDRKIW